MTVDLKSLENQMSEIQTISSQQRIIIYNKLWELPNINIQIQRLKSETFLYQ